MRLTIRDVRKMKNKGKPLVMLTAYDATSARMAEMSDVPMILVGDTLGMVVQGHHSTIPVKLEHMIYHCSIVVRVTQKPLIVGDLPFMTYSVSPEQALENAGRLMQDSGVSCVKLEGGERMASTIKRIVESGIPVMGHIGLTPQSVNQFGGFRVQGKQLDSARQVIHDAQAIQDAGAFSVVLELVPSRLAKLITEILDIPTIGIGAGVHCDGQVQVFHDILALFDDFIPRHTKRYTNIGDMMRSAIAQYRTEVENHEFPTVENSFTMEGDVIDTLQKEFNT
jgi:3-methyl-2-oxobutanoate hydroxymethyltransferase